MTRTILLCALATLVLLAGSGGPALAECNADIRGTLTRKENTGEKTVYNVMVEIELNERCAIVDFDLVVVENVGGGEKEEVRVSRSIKIRDSVKGTMKLDYRLKKGRTVASHRFEQTSCTPCE